MAMFAGLTLLLLLCCSVSQNGVANSFVPMLLKLPSWQQPMLARRWTDLPPLCSTSNNNNDDNAAIWKNKNNIDNYNDSTPKLGIDIVKQLKPLSEDDVAELHAQAYISVV